MSGNGPPKTKLVIETSIDSTEYDGIILISAPEQNIKYSELSSVLFEALSYDSSLKTETAVIPIKSLSKRLVHSPTGPIDLDYDDVRIFKKAATAGIKRALKAGIKSPLLVLEQYSLFENVELVTLLGALEALYTPIQIREHDPFKTHKVEKLGIISDNPDKSKKLVATAEALDHGRRVALDIADADPERMAPLKIEEYVRDLFADTNIKIEVISDLETIKKDYPLFEAVNRAASVVERHRGRIIFLKYDPPESAEETLYLVGKGVTYDTGGADVKINGAMFGMSRDKCGAAAVAGFLQMVNLIQPKKLKVVGAMSVVRNSIGSNGYVADEVITARSGARVRVINTDAEGRMVMADVLHQLKEEALKAVNPHLYTIATLTGHAFLSVGKGYSIVMDNGPASKTKNNADLQKAGDIIGDPFEISTIRKEDFSNYKGVAEGDDVVQGQTKPSTQTTRGHQGPAAFLILASGLDKHGTGSEHPLKYSHLDIAGSAGDFPNPATGSPVLALAQKYLL